MGEYVHAVAPCRDPEELTLFLVDTARKFWGDEVEVVRVEGVPTSKQDDRVAKWAFMSTAPEWKGCDALFAASLLRDGRMEFKLVPWGNEKTYQLRSHLRSLHRKRV